MCVPTASREPVGPPRSRPSRDQAPGPAIAGLLRAELPSLTAEIVEEIRTRIPEYDRPLESRFGAGLRRGVAEGLGRFVDEVADPDGPERRDTEVHRALGREEFLGGRNLDALQAAYLIGARIAWRRFSEAGAKADIPPDRMYLLAERLFDFIEEVSAHSVNAYRELRARAVSPVRQKRQRLLHLLVAEPALSEEGRLVELAREAQWPLPQTISCVAVDGGTDTGRRLPPALDPDVLIDLDGPDPCLIVPDPQAPGRYDMLRRGLKNVAFAYGPAVPVADAAFSLRLARRGLTLMHQGILPRTGQVRCDDHLATLHLLGDAGSMRILCRHALSSLGRLNPGQRTRLSETLLAWLSTGSSIPDVAARLHLHPQTVRYRMRRIEELFGDRLRDPDWRFEMELALRAWQLTRLPDPKKR
jgi:hypothetical protein